MSRPQPLLLSLLLAASPLLAANALVNGGFESGLDGWRVWGAVPSSATHSGAASMEATSATDAWVGVDQVLAIPKGTGRLRLSGWLRSDSLRQGPEDWNKGRLGLDFLDDRDSLAGGYQMVAIQVRGRMAWTRGERVYPIPQGATKAKIICALADARGTLHCDDLEAEFLP